nr:hypothetical protein [Mucilaginibacter sp. FT3.2]
MVNSVSDCILINHAFLFIICKADCSNSGSIAGFFKDMIVYTILKSQNFVCTNIVQLETIPTPLISFSENVYADSS